MTLRPHFGVPETTSRPLRRYVLPASSTGVNFAKNILLVFMRYTLLLEAMQYEGVL